MQYTGFYDDSYVANRYSRLTLAGDVLYHTYRFGPMTILYPKQKNTVTVFTDTYARQMADRGIITREALASYENAVCGEFSDAVSHSELGALQTYRLICNLRRLLLGSDAMEQAREAESKAAVQVRQSICEDAKKAQLLSAATTAVFLLYDAAYLEQLRQDILAANAAGHRVCVVVCREQGEALPTRQTFRNWLGDVQAQYLQSADGGLETVCWDAQLQEEIDRGQAAVFAYGEEALLVCRSLRTDAVVMARPQGHCTRAMINQLGCDTACTVYVPRHLDITKEIPLTDKTRISYWHLAMLRRDVSAQIDNLSLEQLYRRYPAYFLNRYENGADCTAAAGDYPISVTIPAEEPDPVASFEQYREAAVSDYINSLNGISYRCAYFDADGNLCDVPWRAEQPQEGILVNAVRVKRAKGSKVVDCGGGVTLRQRLQGEGTGVVSNFLFFLTPKLAALYNELRQDRPCEQAQLAGKHLDYMLTTENGVRRESFPLFRKTCIAMTENGEFRFFNFRLGGGKVRIGTQWIAWEKQDVDPEKPGAVCVYTPYATARECEADRQTYRKAVGQGRVNFVFLQDRLHCVRSGDVILPSVGVVLSLERSCGEVLLDRLQLKPLENGYYAPSEQTQIQLDPPDGIAPEEWAQLKWAYGGGLSLILDHKAVTDREDMIPWFEAEGWMSPLSRQTQESTLHTLAKHPRTAIGIGDNGDLLILVFSGRTRVSSGADYKEMCHIARTLYPDVHSLMNADGGGSAVLGLVCRGSFMELSYPSTSTGSTVGMARPIQTAFYIAKEETK